MKRMALACSLALLAHPALADKASNSINAAFTQEVATLDSYKESGRVGLIIARLLYDGLISKDTTTGEFSPELASSYTFLSPTEIEFKIRQGVKFHDGSTMTADDVVYTLNTVSNPDYGARYSIAVNWIEKAEKTSDDTVVVTMKSPYPMALEMFAGNLPIYPKAYYEKVGPEGMGINPIGTGPYKLVDMTQGVRFVLEKFDGYYEGGEKSDAKIDKITIRVLPELNTQYAELMNGQLDWLWRVPPDDVKRLESLSGIKVEAAPIMRFEYINMNPNALAGNTPLANLEVRQAINHAINREAIRNALVGEGSILTNSACNPVQFGCTQDVHTYDYDPAKAKELLAEAGYPDGFTIDMLVTSVPSIDAEAIAADLAKVGITATINRQQYASSVDLWRKNEAPMMLANWGSYGVGDIGLSTANFFGDTGDNMAKNAEVTALITDAGRTQDRDRRKEDYAKALNIIADEAYWVPLWTYTVNTPMSADLELKTNPDEFVPFYDAYWK